MSKITYRTSDEIPRVKELLDSTVPYSLTADPLLFSVSLNLFSKITYGASILHSNIEFCVFDIHKEVLQKVRGSAGMGLYTSMIQNGLTLKSELIAKPFDYPYSSSAFIHSSSFVMLQLLSFSSNKSN